MNAALEDFGINPNSLTPEGVAEYMDRRVRELVAEIEASTAWRALIDPVATPAQIREILKEVYLEIYLYQQDSLEAAIAAIGQMPRSIPPALIDAMLHQQVEEFDHGEMALRDYVASGGSETFARTRDQTPSAFAVAAVWRNFVHKRRPFMYLGALFLFENLTPIVTQRALEALADRQLSATGLEFITHHATADIEHADQLRELIEEVAKIVPGAKPDLIYGFEHFRHVYPLPGWQAAVDRANDRFRNFSQAAE